MKKIFLEEFPEEFLKELFEKFLTNILPKNKLKIFFVGVYREVMLKDFLKKLFQDIHWELEEFSEHFL